MDDIMILMNKVIIDIHGGFDETQFGIFDDDEQDQLRHIWHNIAKRDATMFINILSPAQKQRVALWAANRTEYSVDALVKALKKFTKFLESSSYIGHDLYPKPKRVRNTSIFSMKKNIQ
jgi:predicted HAD superfamily phosphohydrolase YqeG